MAKLVMTTAGHGNIEQATVQAEAVTWAMESIEYWATTSRQSRQEILNCAKVVTPEFIDSTWLRGEESNEVIWRNNAVNKASRLYGL